MIEERAADAEETRLRFGTPDLVEESAGDGSAELRRGALGVAADVTNAPIRRLAHGPDAFAEVVHEFLHPFHLNLFRRDEACLGFVKQRDVVEHVAAGWVSDRLATQPLANLVEEPGAANHATANHQAPRLSLRQDFQRLSGGIDVPIRDHRARQGFSRAANQIVVNRQTIHLRHGARVNREQINRVLREDRQQRVKLVRRSEAHARFHRELDAHRIAQRAENGVNALRFAEQSAAGAFLVNDRRGAAEIQVNRHDREALQFFRGAHERGNVVADHLRDDRLARGVLFDGRHDPGLQS